MRITNEVCLADFLNGGTRGSELLYQEKQVGFRRTRYEPTADGHYEKVVEMPMKIIVLTNP